MDQISATKAPLCLTGAQNVVNNSKKIKIIIIVVAIIIVILIIIVVLQALGASWAACRPQPHGFKGLGIL